MTSRIVTVLGARPQFIKAAPVSRALAGRVEEILIHTGQHYDDLMSDIFFRELGLPPVACNLHAGSGTHGRMTGRILIELDEILERYAPDLVLVYGDTNSTLAGALAAAKLRIPVAHVEAGLRCFDRNMPEEINRIVTDRVSSLLFCPTESAVCLLAREGITEGVHFTGDVMYDSVLHNAGIAARTSEITRRLGLTAGGYYLATVHRPDNADDPERLAAIRSALGRLDGPVIFPAHPRTRRLLDALGEGATAGNVRVTAPVGYLDMLALEQGARAILTDSGGVQKEAYFLGVPCVTLYHVTPWVETVEAGWNQVVGADPDAIVRAARRPRPSSAPPAVFGDGHAAEHIAGLLIEGVH